MLPKVEPLLSVYINRHAKCRLAQISEGQSSRPNYRWIPNVDCSLTAESPHHGKRNGKKSWGKKLKMKKNLSALEDVWVK